MRRVEMKRLMAFLICLILATTMIVPVFAEDDPEYDMDASEDIPEFDGDSSGQNIKEINDNDNSSYSISVSKKNVSFGKITVGAPADAQCITISNTGKKDVNLIWKDVDPDNAFLVDVTQAEYIPAGGSANVYVSLTTNKGAGLYSAIMQFADESDPAYDSGIKVELSVTVIPVATKINRVTLKPGSVSTTPGSSVDFFAEVEGEGDVTGEVTYSVNGSASADTKIDSNGHLVIGSNEGDKVFYVQAVSKEDSSKSDKVAVEVMSNVYSVNISSYPGEGGNVSGGGTYKQGARVELTASPKTGWKFNGWSVNGSEVGGSTTYTIEALTDNINAVAYFEQNLIRVKTESNHEHMGSVNGDFYVSKGDSVTLEAFPEDGYKFSCWMEGKKKISSDKKYTVKNITSERSFKAIFVKDKCVVKVATCDETMGTVSGGKKVESGTDVKIKATPKSGYTFVKWVCNDQYVSNSAEYTLKKVTDDITMVAIFESTEKKIKVVTINSGTVDNNGIISPSGAIQIEEGKSINFTVTPKSGYQIAAVAVDGKQIGVQNSFTISNVRGDHNVVAAFLPIAKANVVTDKEKKNTETAAQNSDLHKETGIETKKIYEENIMEMEDAPERVSEENADESMDNSLDEQDGLLQKLNMTDEEADEAIANDGKLNFIQTAVAEEALEVNVSNMMRKDPMPIAYGGDALENPEVKNFTEVICNLFEDDEVKRLASGDESVSVSITVAGTEEDNVPQEQKDLIESSLAQDETVGKYFFTSFVKTVDGVSSVVSEIEKPIIIRVDVPDEIYEAGRTYAVARLHYKGMGDSEVTVLGDSDNDPKTITFETDRFSTYAIIYSDGVSVQSAGVAGNANGLKMVIAVIAALGILMAIITFVVVARNTPKRHRRR